MSAQATGAVVGIGLAVILLQFGFWGLLLAVLLGAIGWVVGGALGGRIDLRGVADALRGRRTG